MYLVPDSNYSKMSPIEAMTALRQGITLSARDIMEHYCSRLRTTKTVAPFDDKGVWLYTRDGIRFFDGRQLRRPGKVMRLDFRGQHFAFSKPVSIRVVNDERRVRQVYRLTNSCVYEYGANEEEWDRFSRWCGLPDLWWAIFYHGDKSIGKNYFHPVIAGKEKGQFSLAKHGGGRHSCCCFEEHEDRSPTRMRAVECYGNVGLILHDPFPLPTKFGAVIRAEPLHDFLADDRNNLTFYGITSKLDFDCGHPFAFVAARCLNIKRLGRNARFTAGWERDNYAKRIINELESVGIKASMTEGGKLVVSSLPLSFFEYDRILSSTEERPFAFEQYKLTRAQLVEKVAPMVLARKGAEQVASAVPQHAPEVMQ